MRTQWRKDGWGHEGNALYFGNIFVGQVLRWKEDKWRAWFMLADDEDDPGCHLGWFATRELARECVQQRAEQEIDTALTIITQARP
jgi:hypothetical protein